MLGKLIKHEWKSVSKVGCIILISAFVIAVIGCLFLSADSVVNLFAGNIHEDSLQAFGAVLMLIMSFGAYLLLLVGGMYGIMIYLGVHFYRSMYTDKGYLVHTLPVTPHQILLSKTIVSGIWMLIVNLALIIGALLLFAALISSIARGEEPGITFADMWSTLGREFSREMAGNKEVKNFFITYIVVIVISLLISPFASMAMMFGGLTIGQLSKKYKLLMSILAYIGILILNYIISMVASIASAVVSTSETVISSDMPTNTMGITFGITLGSMVLLSVLLYFVAHYIISKKLNLD